MNLRTGVLAALVGCRLVLACSGDETSSGSGSPGSPDAGDSGKDALVLVPCPGPGGACVEISACARADGKLLGSPNKYSCDTNRNICCFSDCGGTKEDFECCNTDRTLAARPTCSDNVLACAANTTKTPIGACLGDGGTGSYDGGLDVVIGPADAGRDAKPDSSEGDAAPDAPRDTGGSDTGSDALLDVGLSLG